MRGRGYRRWIHRTGAVRAVLAVGLLGGLVAWSVAAPGGPSYEEEPINYLTAPVNDPVARLQEKIDRGEVRLRFDREQGYLPAVLEALEIPVESQMLVFSKTSFQASRIAPRSPRAIYFNDEVYIGWVRGGDMLEISSVDPQQGAVFYLLDQIRTDQPIFDRQTHSCLSCHATSMTENIPGHLVRSVYPNPDGTPAYSAGTFLTGHESPLSERWGGWYVTGTHGDQRHMGNVFVRDQKNPEDLDTDAGANLTDLAGRFDPDSYPGGGQSDIVALMVLEHQTQMHNRIASANYEARQALYYQQALDKALGRTTGTLSESTRRRIDRAAEKVVQYLLFSGETTLTAPVEGTSDFAERFAALGPRDAKGRSLREFDLKTRLFRYPCSYLVYSEAFTALPTPVKDQIALRLGEILTAEDPGPEFAHLSPEDRTAIFEILRDTVPDLFTDESGTAG